MCECARGVWRDLKAGWFAPTRTSCSAGQAAAAEDRNNHLFVYGCGS